MRVADEAPFLPELFTEENLLRTADRLAAEPGFAAALGREAVFEAVCYSCGHGAPALAGLQREEQWWHALAQAHEQASEGGWGGELLTDAQWEEACAAAFDAAGPQKEPGLTVTRGRRRQKPLAGRRRFTALAAAAAVVLALAGAFVLMRQSAMNRPPHGITSAAKPAAVAPRPVVTPHPASPAGDTSGLPRPAAPIARYGLIERGQRPIDVPAHRQGLVQLKGRSAILAEASAKLAVRTESDSTAAIDLLRGSALFAVEQRRYRSFTVLTPHAAVRVTGTIFRVSVDSLRTEVTVLEGSVEVIRHDERKDRLSLAAGHCLAVQPDSVITRMIRDSRTLAGRSRLLQDLLSARYAQDGIYLDDSLIFAEIDGFERRILDSLARAADSAAIRRSLLYAIARTLEDGGQTSEALRLYARLYEGETGDALGPLARIRSALVLLRRADEPREALPGLSAALRQTPAGVLHQAGLAALILSHLRAGSDSLALPLMRQYLADYPSAPPAEAIAFQCGQILRLRAGDWAAAAAHYAFVAQQFPHGSLREDALYWAGWCRGQSSAEGIAERGAEKFRRVYPERPGRSGSPR